MSRKKNKNVEPEVKADQAPMESSDPRVEFDAWYASRGPKIPKHHHKEIIKADFNARDVKLMSTMAEWDAALKMYGVILPSDK